MHGPVVHQYRRYFVAPVQWQTPIRIYLGLAFGRARIGALNRWRQTPQCGAVVLARWNWKQDKIKRHRIRMAEAYNITAA